MFPSHASLYAAPVQLDSYMGDLVGCWSNVYGFDMTPMAQILITNVLMIYSGVQLDPDPI